MTGTRQSEIIIIGAAIVDVRRVKRYSIRDLTGLRISVCQLERMR